MLDFLRTLVGLFVTSYKEQRVDNLNRKPPVIFFWRCVMADENVDGEQIKRKTSEAVTDVAKGKFLSIVMKC